MDDDRRPSLREFIQARAKDEGLVVDRDLETFIFYVVIGWQGAVSEKASSVVSQAREKLRELDAVLNPKD